MCCYTYLLVYKSVVSLNKPVTTHAIKTLQCFPLEISLMQVCFICFWYVQHVRIWCAGIVYYLSPSRSTSPKNVFTVGL